MDKKTVKSIRDRLCAASEQNERIDIVKAQAEIEKIKESHDAYRGGVFDACNAICEVLGGDGDG